MTERTAGEAEAFGGGTPAGVRGAMAEFVSELRTFRETIEHKMQAQEKRMTMLDRKTAFRSRSFSFSSSFSRLTWSLFSPPYSLRHR